MFGSRCQFYFWYRHHCNQIDCIGTTAITCEFWNYFWRIFFEFFILFQLQISEVIQKTRHYMEDIAGGTGNVLTHHKTIRDLEKYFGTMGDNKDVKEFLEKMTTDKEGWVDKDHDLDTLTSTVLFTFSPEFFICSRGLELWMTMPNSLKLSVSLIQRQVKWDAWHLKLRRKKKKCSVTWSVD